MTSMLKGAPLIAVLGLTIVAVGARQSGNKDDRARQAERVEHGLKRVVRVVDRPDSAFDIADRMRYWHVPGVSIAVVDDFRIVYAKGFGVTQFGGASRVDTTTLFLAGSISKPVFATGVLRLVEQG